MIASEAELQRREEQVAQERQLQLRLDLARTESAKAESEAKAQDAALQIEKARTKRIEAWGKAAPWFSVLALAMGIAVAIALRGEIWPR